MIRAILLAIDGFDSSEPAELLAVVAAGLRRS